MKTHEDMSKRCLQLVVVVQILQFPSSSNLFKQGVLLKKRRKWSTQQQRHSGSKRQTVRLSGGLKFFFPCVLVMLLHCMRTISGRRPISNTVTTRHGFSHHLHPCPAQRQFPVLAHFPRRCVSLDYLCLLRLVRCTRRAVLNDLGGQRELVVQRLTWVRTQRRGWPSAAGRGT